MKPAHLTILLSGALALGRGNLPAFAQARDAGARPSKTPPERPPQPKEDGSCKKPPSEKALVKLNLKPDTEVAEVVSWFSAVTCTPMLMSSGVPLAGKKITILAPKPITVAEARRLFFAALDSVGLAVERNGKFLRIIEAGRARSSITPIHRAPAPAAR